MENSRISSFSEPVVYHREYKNDLPKESKEAPLLNQSLRVTKVALPFLTLYRPLGQPLSIILGSTRVINSVAQMIQAMQSKDSTAIGRSLLETGIATTALACSIFAHPLGMLVTTSHDMIVNVVDLTSAIQDKDYKRAAEMGMQLVNNALYLSYVCAGTLELSIASIGFQIFLGLYTSCNEFRSGNYLEGCGHLLMAGVRGNQMVQQVQVFQLQKKFEKMVQEVREEKAAKAPVDEKNVKTLLLKENPADEFALSLVRYEKNPDGLPPLLCAAKQGDLKSIRLFIKHGADPFMKCSEGLSALHYALFSKNHRVVSFFLNQGLSPNNDLSLNHSDWIGFVDLKSFKLLVNHGFPINASTYPNTLQNPSIQALSWGRLDLLQFILSNGGDFPPKRSAGHGDLILWTAAYNRPGRNEEKLECVKWLVSRGTLDLKDTECFMPSLYNSSANFIEYLLDNNYIKVNEPIKFGKSLIEDRYYQLITYLNYREDTLQLLINRGYDLNKKSVFGYTPLHQLVIGLEHLRLFDNLPPHLSIDERLSCIKLLLDHGADVNTTDYIFHGTSPLADAIHRGVDSRIQDLLRQYGAVSIYRGSFE